MTQRDEITLTLPRDREFHRVAHLVVGGLALRLDLTIETLEDLQLALSEILDRSGPNDHVTISLSVADGILEACVGPVDVADELAGDSGGLTLNRILSAVVDEVKVDGPHVRLLKKIGSDG